MYLFVSSDILPKSPRSRQSFYVMQTGSKVGCRCALRNAICFICPTYPKGARCLRGEKPFVSLCLSLVPQDPWKGPHRARRMSPCLQLRREMVFVHMFYYTTYPE